MEGRAEKARTHFVEARSTPFEGGTLPRETPRFLVFETIVFLKVVGLMGAAGSGFLLGSELKAVGKDHHGSVIGICMALLVASVATQWLLGSLWLGLAACALFVITAGLTYVLKK